MHPTLSSVCLFIPPVLFLMSRVLVIRCQQVFVWSSVPEHKAGHTLDTTHNTPLFHFFNF